MWHCCDFTAPMRCKYTCTVALNRRPSLLCTKPVTLHHRYERLLEKGLCPPSSGGDVAHIACCVFALLADARKILTVNANFRILLFGAASLRTRIKYVVTLLGTYPVPPGLTDAEPDRSMLDGPGDILSSCNWTPNSASLSARSFSKHPA